MYAACFVRYPITIYVHEIGLIIVVLQVFLYLFALIIFLGVLHAFVLLPILLVVVAPSGTGGRGSHDTHDGHHSVCKGATPNTSGGEVANERITVTEVNALSSIGRQAKIAPASATTISGGLDTATGQEVLLESLSSSV